MAGKEAARRNALKHGLTGGGVVIPGEDEHEVAIRVAALEAELVPEGSVLAALLVRQVAIASVRVERAYRHETALAAERMRRSTAVFDDARQVTAQEFLGQISHDPATMRRRLMTAHEGIDALLGRLRALRTRAEAQPIIVWDGAEGTELDYCMGQMPGQTPLSRAAMLTRGISYDYWEDLNPAEFAGLIDADRQAWAVGEIRVIIDGAIAQLEAHRATLDTTHAAQSRAEAPERTLLDVEAEGTAIRRYAGAAERTMFKLLKELRIMRFEAQLRELPPAEAATKLTAMVTEMPALQEVGDELAPFCTPVPPQPRARRRATLESIVTDPKASSVPITIGQNPAPPTPPAS